MKNLIIIGAGGFAREVYWNAQKTEGFNSDWKIKGFLDGDVKLSDEDYKKLPIFAASECRQRVRTFAFAAEFQAGPF